MWYECEIIWRDVILAYVFVNVSVRVSKSKWPQTKTLQWLSGLPDPLEEMPEIKDAVQPEKNVLDLWVSHAHKMKEYVRVWR